MWWTRKHFNLNIALPLQNLILLPLFLSKLYPIMFFFLQNIDLNVYNFFTPCICVFSLHIHLRLTRETTSKHR